MKRLGLLKLLMPLLVILGLYFSSCSKDGDDNPSETPENGNESLTAGKAIDLGLSVKWASCNVGASSPKGYGRYYAWGETEEKSNYTTSTYKYYDSKNDEYINIGSSICGTQYDVARVKWGGSWRMPTLDEEKELVNKCSWQWTNNNEIKGYLVTGPNGNSIFLPTSYLIGTGLYKGYYWSGMLGNIDGAAYYLQLLITDKFGGSYCVSNDGWREERCWIRPVTE